MRVWDLRTMRCVQQLNSRAVTESADGGGEADLLGLGSAAAPRAGSGSSGGSGGSSSTLPVELGGGGAAIVARHVRYEAGIGMSDRRQVSAMCFDAKHRRCRARRRLFNLFLSFDNCDLFLFGFVIWLVIIRNSMNRGVTVLDRRRALLQRVYVCFFMLLRAVFLK